MVLKNKNTVGIAMKSALGQNIPVSLEKRKGFVSLFMNQQRRKLFHYLCNYPCSNMRMISRDMGIGLPSARWHLDHLQKMGFIERQEIGKFKVFYPCRFLKRDFVESYALLNKDQARDIFKIVLEKGGISHQELSEGTNLSPQNLGGWIKKFEAVGLIAPVKDGRMNRYFPTVMVSEMESIERGHRNGFKRFILNKLHLDGVNPKVVESSGNRYVLEIKVGRDSYYLKLTLTPLRTILEGRAAFVREFPVEVDEKKEVDPTDTEDPKNDELPGSDEVTPEDLPAQEPDGKRELVGGLDKFRKRTQKK